MKKKALNITKFFIALLFLLTLVPVYTSDVLADDGWEEITNLNTTGDLVDFVIDSNLIGDPSNTYMGHLRIGKPGELQNGKNFNVASYYITRSDGVTTEQITYGYRTNTFHTSYSLNFIEGASGIEMQPFDINLLETIEIDSVWTKDRVPGYTMLQLRGTLNLMGQPVEARLTLIPYENGLVLHNFEITNNGPDALEFGFVRTIDTDLETNGAVNDAVNVYSLGTNKGMYIEDPVHNVRVLFPYVLPTHGGPNDYNADGYWAYHTFGWNMELTREVNVPREMGDLLLEETDSGVMFFWKMENLAPGESRLFSYAVSLSGNYPLDAPIITNVTFPATVNHYSDFTAEVTWQDYDSPIQDLYYMLDGAVTGTFYATSSDNPINFIISTNSISVGNHTLAFYTIDPDGAESNVYEISFEVLEVDTYSIIYNINGGDAGTGPVSETTLLSGSHPLNNTTIPTHPDDSGEAVVFIGWTASQDTYIYEYGDGASLPARITSATITEADVTVWALWGYDVNENGVPDVFEVGYTVEYYYDGVIDPSLTYHDIAPVEKLIGDVTIPSQLKENFVLDHVEGLYPRIRDNENDNIISVYYRNNQQPNTGDINTLPVIGLMITLVGLMISVRRKRESE